MLKRGLIGLGVALAGIWIYFSLQNAPVLLVELLKEPLYSLWGTHQRLQAGVLEVSENIGTVEDATRRLLKPFGRVRLIRRVSAPVLPENPPPPLPPPAQ
jgi:hypothetical protein